MDVRLPPTFTDEGLQAALDARRETPGLPVLVLSQHVEQLYARELLADGAGGDRIPAQGPGRQRRPVRRRGPPGSGRRTAMDPEVIAKLVTTPPADGPLGRLTPRERDVLELMAQGRSNAAIAQRLFLSESAVGKHTASIFAKLDLPPSDDDNRRVLAVLAYLNDSA